MADFNFRRIDVDQYDPDSHVTLEDITPQADPVSYSDITAKAQQIRNLLQKGANEDALLLALDDPPYGGDEKTKDLHLSTVLDVLAAIKVSSVTNLVENLDGEQQNVLVKYLYKGMGSPVAAGSQAHNIYGVLLSWFDKTIEVTGNGPIVRYLSDRRLV